MENKWAQIFIREVLEMPEEKTVRFSVTTGTRMAYGYVDGVEDLDAELWDSAEKALLMANVVSPA